MLDIIHYIDAAYQHHIEYDELTIAQMRAGQQHGFCISYRGENSQIHRISHWRNNHTYGIFMHFVCGQINEIEYRYNGQRHGLYIYYDKNGQIRELSHWRNDQPHGLYIRYESYCDEIDEVSNWQNGQRCWVYTNRDMNRRMA